MPRPVIRSSHSKPRQDGMITARMPQAEIDDLDDAAAMLSAGALSAVSRTDIVRAACRAYVSGLRRRAGTGATEAA